MRLDKAICQKGVTRTLADLIADGRRDNEVAFAAIRAAERAARETDREIEVIIEEREG